MNRESHGNETWLPLRSNSIAEKLRVHGKTVAPARVITEHAFRVRLHLVIIRVEWPDAFLDLANRAVAHGELHDSPVPAAECPVTLPAALRILRGACWNPGIRRVRAAHPAHRIADLRFR